MSYHFLSAFKIYDYLGNPISSTAEDYLLSKTLALFFLDASNPASFQSILRPLALFYNSVNGLNPATKLPNGEKGANVEFLIVSPTNCQERDILTLLQKPEVPPFSFLSPVDECASCVKISQDYEIDDFNTPSLIVVNYDGSIISSSAVVDICSNGDACLMTWQMFRMAEPVLLGEEEEQVEDVPDDVKKEDNKITVGGVTLDLPF